MRFFCWRMVASLERKASTSSRSAIRMPVRACLSTYAGPMPRCVLSILSAQFIHFLDQPFGIDDDAIADDAGCIGIKNTGWDKTEGEFTFFMHYAVAGIATALIPHDEISMHCQFIDDLAFAFIAPLCAYNSNCYHDNIPFNLLELVK